MNLCDNNVTTVNQGKNLWKEVSTLHEIIKTGKMVELKMSTTVTIFLTHI